MLLSSSILVYIYIYKFTNSTMHLNAEPMQFLTLAAALDHTTAILLYWQLTQLTHVTQNLQDMEKFAYYLVCGAV